MQVLLNCKDLFRDTETTVNSMKKRLLITNNSHASFETQVTPTVSVNCFRSKRYLNCCPLQPSSSVGFLYLCVNRKGSRRLWPQTSPSLSLSTSVACSWFTAGTATSALRRWVSSSCTEGWSSPPCRYRLKHWRDIFVFCCYDLTKLWEFLMISFMTASMSFKVMFVDVCFQLMVLFLCCVVKPKTIFHIVDNKVPN